MDRSSHRHAPTRRTPHYAPDAKALEPRPPACGSSKEVASREVLEVSSRFERLLLARLRALEDALEDALEGKEPAPPRLVW